MSLEEALQAVQAVIDGRPSLRIARRGIREDDTHYLVPVLDTRQVQDGGEGRGPSESQLLIVDKESGDVEPLTVSAALARSRMMRESSLS